jgi:formylmethanofuran dehydrogenase subunit E
MNGPTEVQVLREMLISGQKPTRTMLTKENQPNKSVAADGCIVPKVALNGKAPIVLTDVGKELFAIWKSGRDAELNAVLDKTLMRQLEQKLVESLEDRKKVEKQQTKEEATEYGFKKLSKSKPCHNCENMTLKSYNFGDKSRKAIPFCHRKVSIFWLSFLVSERSELTKKV